MKIFYSGVGKWFYEDICKDWKKIYLTGLVRETGVFELGGINSKEIQYKQRTDVYYLKSCETHNDGVDQHWFPEMPRVCIAYFEPEKPIDISVKDVIDEKIKTIDDSQQHPVFEKVGENILKRTKQVNFICKTAQELGYSDVLNIPVGGKAAIKIECLKNKMLFTDSGFDHAWKAGNKRKKIQIENKELYL